MANLIQTSSKSELSDFSNLFIEMSVKNCNQRCKHCYIDFQNAKQIKNFIPIDTIKHALSELKHEKIQYIHLTGAEPMTHPDFNAILRYCLKHASTVIHTNAYSINDKKARFLKKVEDENSLNHEIILKLSLEHYEERINDNIRGRGSFRKTIHAIQHLIKYGFNPLITVVNHFNEDEDELKRKFVDLFNQIDFKTDDININIIPLMKRDKFCDLDKVNSIYKNLDCSKSRTLTSHGIYNCIMTTEDYRGRSGKDFNEYSKNAPLETQFCSYCMLANKPFFSIF